MPPGAREQPGQGVAAEDQDDVGPDDLDLGVEERGAGLHLGGLRVAVARRAALDHVGDVDVVAAQPDALQEPGQHVPGGADEGLADAVLVLARPLPHRHDPARRRAGPGDGLGAPGVERARGADQDVLVDDGQGIRGATQHRRDCTFGAGWGIPARPAWGGPVLGNVIREAAVAGGQNRPDVPSAKPNGQPQAGSAASRALRPTPLRNPLAGRSAATNKRARRTAATDPTWRR